MRIFRPEVFQGSLKLKNYFEGWYFKHVTADLSNTLSIIPGVSLVKNDPHAFIQIINGSDATSHYVRYPLSEFSFDRRSLFVRIGSSLFSSNGIEADIEGENIRVAGKLAYRNMVTYPKSLLSPGIMGWYSFIPFMECNHGVVSVNHDITGNLTINGKETDFNGGKGYIEKDWGTSFPEAWIWVQSNNFGADEVSFMLSIAKIPWLGSFFTGFISFLYLRGQFYLFSTYGNSTFTLLKNNSSEVEFEMRNRRHILRAGVQKRSFGELIAPVSGEMKRGIRESIDSEVQIRLSDNNNNAIYSGTGMNVGFEVTEEIFNYL
jgi:hypothetical protein